MSHKHPLGCEVVYLPTKKIGKVIALDGFIVTVYTRNSLFPGSSDEVYHSPVLVVKQNANTIITNIPAYTIETRDGNKITHVGENNIVFIRE